MAEADDHLTAPQRNWLDLDRRQRKQLREANIRAAEEAAAARQRPGSNIPPITDAEVAASAEQLRHQLTVALEQTDIVLPAALPLVRDILVFQRHYIGGANVLDMGLQVITLLVRHVDQPGSVLHETDALESARIVLNAMNHAAAGNLAPLRALLPEPGPPGERLDPDAFLRAAAAAGVAGLSRGAGRVSQTRAAVLVSEVFQAAGLTVTPPTALQHHKRLSRSSLKHTGADAAAAKLYADMVVRMPAVWPLLIRKEWLQRLAAAAARNLGV